MATDITTLAIEIQSQEAERNLRTFNELLSLSSQTAQKMEKVSIEIDANEALAQLQALKAGYNDLAAAAQNVHFDMGGGAPSTGAPTIDTEALNALKEFFASSAEMSKALREELEQFSEAMKKLEADTIKVSTAGGRTTGSMRGGAAVSREYAAALRELISAQKEMEKAVAQADEAMKATVAADQDAEAVKKRLTQAERELASVSKQLAATHSGMGGDIIGLSEKEDHLKNKVAELKSVYAEAKAAAEKFNQKLEESASKADLASAKYKELKAKVESMPQNPMGGASQSTQTFAEKAKLAGTQLTKLARGFNSVAMLAGGAIPGVSGLGRAISMFGMVNPYIAAAALAIGACVAVYKEYDKVMQDTAVAAREMAAEQAKLATSFKKEAQERQSNLDRLAVLNNYENLYDVEKEESRRIVEKLTDAYKGLGIQYDALTGKVSNLAEITRKMSEQDRKAMLAKQQSAVEMARSAASTQLAESKRNSIGWFRNLNTGTFGMSGGFDIDLFGIPITRKQSARGYADEWYNYINSAKDLEEQIERVNKAILHLDEIRRKGGTNAWALDAKNWSEELKKARTALLEYQKQAKIFRELQDTSGVGGGRSKEAIGESLRARKAKLQTARNASKSESERYEENVTALERLYAKKQEIAALAQKAEVVYGGKKITAAEALLDIETEITNRTRERLAYEKQLEAQEKKLEAAIRAQDKAYLSAMSPYKMAAYGFARKDSVEMNKDRQREQRQLYDEMAAMRDDYRAKFGRSFTSDLYQGILPKELQLKYGEKFNRIQQLYVQLSETRQAAAEAKKQWEKGRSGFVYDKKGNIVREKNDAELAKVRQQEIAAAKAKVREYSDGSVQYYQAQAELERLQREDFKKRQELSFTNLSFSQMQAHNNMVQGLAAKSSQALRLETRNFIKPDNAWKTLEKKQTQIYDALCALIPDIVNIADSSRNMSDKLVNV